MGTLEFFLNTIVDAKGSNKDNAINVWLALKYELVSAVEGAPDGSSQIIPTFEVEIKGALEITIELNLKKHMVVHLLVQKSSQNNSIKGEVEEALYGALEGAPKISP